ncbi:GNAT family N-acetyltransferase [Paenibacillus glufosinatiresistens]|uniref:GNAT family N-acetyltransferase n=1 Tax=Paenibacillus glufosinatiresistens TaxID=3070657 RepID=UPI00286DA2CD|nr:GNAT family N-acetyltransferase [Paenibacillus sp. YX.27]
MEWQIDDYQQWDEAVWAEIRPIYEEAFPHGAKPERVLRAMLERRLASLAVGRLEGEAVGFALSGTVPLAEEASSLRLIDYLAVRSDLRSRGIGARLVEELERRDRRSGEAIGFLIEAEAGETPEDHSRNRFWERLSFVPTEYVHTYIWVPEPYRAYVRPLDPAQPVPRDGRALFQCIETFHKAAFMRYDKRE